MWFANLTKSKQAYGQANGYADQALQHMKVVATYGREFLEQENFTKYLKVWHDTKTANDFTLSLGIGILTFIMFFSMGCQFLIGA